MHHKRIVEFIDENRNYLIKSHNKTAKFFNFVFLCGKEFVEGIEDNRTIIEKKLIDNKIKTLYSEKLFGSLRELDLLTFEEVLLEISSKVIIIVESMGTATELGAFTFVDENLHKLFVINDVKYEQDKSFINLGPIEKIKRSHNNDVYYVEFDEGLITLNSNLLSGLEKISEVSHIETKPYIEGDKIAINDINYLLWLIIDLIKLFVFIEENKTYDLISGIFNNKDVVIETSSGNELTVEETIFVINLIIKMLKEFKVIKLENDKLFINYSDFRENNFDLNKDYSSVLFPKSRFNNLKFIKDRARIINEVKKMGISIWES